MDIRLNGKGINPILDWADKEGEKMFFCQHFDVVGESYIASTESRRVFDEFKSDIDFFNSVGFKHDWEESQYNGWSILRSRGGFGSWYCKKADRAWIVLITEDIF